MKINSRRKQSQSIVQEKSLTLQQKIGRRLVIGVPGTSVTPAIVRHFKNLEAGGIIFYRINFVSPRQIRAFVDQLEKALGRRLLVMVDHEGGRVVMFRDGVTVFPDNLAFGKSANARWTAQQGAIEARELARLGVDVNLSPVLDILTDLYSPNIGVRAYGNRAELVSKLGVARIRAMQQAGISACAKHFPGKGHANVDAHLGLPVIPSTWKEMRALHLKPFLAAIRAGVDLVMTSHPYYPNLHRGKFAIPTFSRKLTHDLLRHELKFKGIICSDDLEMGAVRALCPVGEAAVRATQAGHDLLLVCHDMVAQKKVFNDLLQAYKKKKLSHVELDQSIARISALLTKRPRQPAPRKLTAEKAGAALAKTVAENAVSIFSGHTILSKRNFARKKVGVLFPKFSELSKKIMIEKSATAETQFIKKEFARFGIQPTVQVYPIEPNQKDLDQTTQFIQKQEIIVYFCYDAHLFPGEKEILDRVQNWGKIKVIALLRDPYDAAFINPGSACLTAFGWRTSQLRALIQAMLS